jgi:hypothetical protein
MIPDFGGPKPRVKCSLQSRKCLDATSFHERPSAGRNRGSIKSKPQRLSIHDVRGF